MWIIILFFLATGISGEESAGEIIKKVVDSQHFGFEKGEVFIKITTISKSGDTFSKNLIAKTKDTKKQRKTLIEFTHPSDISGTKYLLIEDKENPNNSEQYLYLPESGKVKRIAGSGKNSSFMGTDFTFYDLEAWSLKSARSRLLKDELFLKRKCFKIEAVPSDSNSSSPYSKLVLLVDKKLYFPLKIDFYDQNGVKIKTLFIKKILKKKGKYYVKKIELANHLKGTKTIVTVLKIFPDKQFDDAIFNKDSLGN